MTNQKKLEVLYCELMNESDNAYEDYKKTNSIGSLGLYTGFLNSATKLYKILISKTDDDHRNI